MSSEHFDALETRDPSERETAQLDALRGVLRHARRHAPAWRDRLAGIDVEAIGSLRDLASLPVLRKSELAALQEDRSGDPFGGLAAVGWGADRPAARRALRVFASPGPIHEPDGARPDYWRMGRALFAAGIRAGDLVHNAFSYHFTPAAAMMESAAHAIGCTVFPAGTGQTEQQVQAIRRLRPDAYTGTPSFLRLLIEKAAEVDGERLSLTKASVGGEAFPPALRDWLGARGVSAYQSYGTADLGLIAYETTAREGLVVDEGALVEIVEPGSGAPVADGEIGEVVVTALNRDYPLIRFATGDLSATLPGPCPTGRTNRRIRGWLGRADQSAKVRGLFVHPSHVAEIVRRHPELGRARLVVEGDPGADRMTLRAEAARTDRALAESVERTIRDVTKLRGGVDLVAAGSLPSDGKVIDDLRPRP